MGFLKTEIKQKAFQVVFCWFQEREVANNRPNGKWEEVWQVVQKGKFGWQSQP